MKTLLSLDGGVLVITEEGGAFTLTINESASIGGGLAAGVVSVKDAGSIVLSGKQAFDLGLKLLEAHSPAAFVPAEEAVGAVADAAIADA